ncbi:hypothetical protein NKR23_g12390 [Pleurostoma richardsiae]|uniref:Argininosuccinate lyase C-terminal domain-containing protein n=1 Tax=Pleurostoma richardsiae TaxID=41990 RepID=A0AA38R1G3_9PEZI|nr:hypothetical protein NKR23_g12390 [Pleurostoma richardsiae]
MQHISCWAEDLIIYSSADIQIAEGVLATLTTQPVKTKVALDPFMLAMDVADYLVRKGVLFPEAHHISGRCAELSETAGMPMNKLAYTRLRELDARFERDIMETFDYEKSMEMRSAKGGTRKQSVLGQIKGLKKILTSPSHSWSVKT